MRSTLSTSLGILLTLAAAVSCGGGDAKDTPPLATNLSWYSTCGDPVCGGYRGPFAGVSLCTAQKAGDACTTANAECDPKSECNARLVCTDTDPKRQIGGCPVSRALYKQDIRYLSDTQKAQIHREIRELKLATYRYKDAGPNSSQRLGFMIDDVERSAGSTLTASAVNAERDQVDLYGYISMAVAALQVQARQIDALQAEVKRLREANGERGGNSAELAPRNNR